MHPHNPTSFGRFPSAGPNRWGTQSITQRKSSSPIRRCPEHLSHLVIAEPLTQDGSSKGLFGFRLVFLNDTQFHYPFGTDSFAGPPDILVQNRQDVFYPDYLAAANPWRLDQPAVTSVLYTEGRVKPDSPGTAVDSWR